MRGRECINGDSIEKNMKERMNDISDGLIYSEAAWRFYSAIVAIENIFKKKYKIQKIDKFPPIMHAGYRWDA